MNIRKVKFLDGAIVEPCPTCGNKAEFSIHSDQVGEDLCELWAACKCGHETPAGYRHKDVFGGCGDENVIMAISYWNEAIAGDE